MAQPFPGQWSYPLEETNGNARRPPKRSDTFSSQPGDYRGGQHQPASSTASRDPKTIRRSPSDVYNIMSDSEEVKQRRVSLKANNSTAGKKRSRNGLREQGGKLAPGERVDDSAWIHRDKLAQIEIQEMEEAGLYIRPSRRSMSAEPGSSRRSSRSMSRSRRPTSDLPPADLEEPLPNGGNLAGYEAYEENYHDKPLPSMPGAQEHGYRAFDPDMDTELRTPGEVAAEQGLAARNYNHNTIRPSTSRIPISKASPVPVPSNVVERDSPLPRSRHGSGAGSGNWDEMQYARRARSGSIGSQVILDEDSHRTPPTSGSLHKQSSGEHSPPKSRVTSKTTPKSGGARKASGTAGVDRPGSSYGKDRKVTTTTPGQRPGSRSGSVQRNGRPSTSHQHTPEGDPPWIDSMYKPDPRLPPDQQMLPTHAKRMMQEQWEREGKPGSTYDRELNLLTDKELPTPKPNLKLSSTDPSAHNQQSPVDGSSLRKSSPRPPNTTGSGNGWPLSPASGGGGENDIPPPSPRPSTTGGGFKLTPKIAAPPTMQKFTPQQQSATGTAGAVRVPDLDEKLEAKGKKGGCGCCVVM